MDRERVFITGLGVVSPYGVGCMPFAKAYPAQEAKITLLEDVSGIWRGGIRGRCVPEYDVKAYLGKKGVRNLDRITLNLCTAVELVHEAIGFGSTDVRRGCCGDERVSINIGTTGPVQSIIDFDLQTVRDPQFVQPGLFPNTVYNAPASYAAIRRAIKAACITVTNGEPSSLDAIRTAAMQLQSGRAKLAFAGGAEELTPATQALHAAVQGSTVAGKRLLGEGAVVLSLVTEEGVHLGEQRILAEVLATASVFHPERRVALDELVERISRLAADEFLLVAHAYSNSVAAVGAHPSLANVSIHSIEPELGYMGAMSGVMAIAAALVDPGIKPGANVLFIDLGVDGAASALLLKKERTVREHGSHSP